MSPQANNKQSWHPNQTQIITRKDNTVCESNTLECSVNSKTPISQELTQFDESRYTKQGNISKTPDISYEDYFDTKLSRPVVIKRFIPSSSNKYKEEQFLKECFITANLNHISIIPIYDIVEDTNKAPICIIKKFTARPLTDILSEKRSKNKQSKSSRDITELLQTFLKVCDTLAYAHSQGIVHLNVKPENILIETFSDVLLINWELAKSINNEATTNNISSIVENFSRNDPAHFHGTPGYMAPEQLSLENISYTKQTDIYGLGCLLYSIITLQAPYENYSLQEIIRATRLGMLPEPHGRTGSKELIAIAYKAMSHYPEDRYQTIKGLEADITNYIAGHSTSAHQVSPVIFLIRLLKKHKVFTLMITLILFLTFLSINLFTSNEQKQSLSWQTNIDIDLTDYTAVQSSLIRIDPLVSTSPLIPVNSVDENGLSPGSSWLYVGQPNNLSDFNEDVKIELDFEWGSWTTLNAIEICFNSEFPQVKPHNNHALKGFSVQIASWVRQYSYISTNKKQSFPNLVNSVPFTAPSTLRNTLRIERLYPDIYVYLNNEKILEEKNNYNFIGRPYGKVRLRSWDPEIKFKHFKISTLKRPQLSSPLDIGDAFATHNNHEIALKEYLKVVKDIHNDEIKEQASKKYIQTLYQLLDNQKITHISLKQKIETLKNYYWSDILNESYINLESIYSWREKNYEKALSLIRQIKSSYTQGKLAQQLLVEKHRPLNQKTGNELLTLLSQKTDIISLDLHDYKLTSLASLKDLNLKILNCNNNSITNLNSLKEMSLINLQIANNRISDLSPLENMPLRQLNISYNKIKQLPKFNKKTLEVFIATEANLHTIDFLKDHPLSTLNISYNPISSIKALKGNLGITDLSMDYTDINDLTPLSKMQLRKLFRRGSYSTERSSINTLSMLDLSQIVSLHVIHAQITNIPDLSSCEQINNLNLSHNSLTDISPLKSLPPQTHFKVFGLAANPITNGYLLKDISADAFQIYDTQITDYSFLYNFDSKMTPIFISESLTAEEINKIKQAWMNNGKSAEQLNKINILHAITTNNLSKLKDMAHIINNKKYLYVDIPFEYKKAKKIAEDAGGNLICFETKDEFNNVINDKSLKLKNKSFYLGLEINNEKKLMWLTGTPLQWELPSLRLFPKQSPQPIFRTNHIIKVGSSYHNMRQKPERFIIEFNTVN